MQISDIICKEEKHVSQSIQEVEAELQRRAFAKHTTPPTLLKVKSEPIWSQVDESAGGSKTVSKQLPMNPNNCFLENSIDQSINRNASQVIRTTTVYTTASETIPPCRISNNVSSLTAETTLTSPSVSLTSIKQEPIEPTQAVASSPALANQKVPSIQQDTAAPQSSSITGMTLAPPSVCLTSIKKEKIESTQAITSSNLVNQRIQQVSSVQQVNPASTVSTISSTPKSSSLLIGKGRPVSKSLLNNVIHLPITKTLSQVSTIKPIKNTLVSSQQQQIGVRMKSGVQIQNAKYIQIRPATATQNVRFIRNPNQPISNFTPRSILRLPVNVSSMVRPCRPVANPATQNVNATKTPSIAKLDNNADDKSKIRLLQPIKSLVTNVPRIIKAPIKVIASTNLNAAIAKSIGNVIIVKPMNKADISKPVLNIGCTTSTTSVKNTCLTASEKTRENISASLLNKVDSTSKTAVSQAVFSTKAEVKSHVLSSSANSLATTTIENVTCTTHLPNDTQPTSTTTNLSVATSNTSLATTSSITKTSCSLATPISSPAISTSDINRATQSDAITSTISSVPTSGITTIGESKRLPQSPNKVSSSNQTAASTNDNTSSSASTSIIPSDYRPSIQDRLNTTKVLKPLPRGVPVNHVQVSAVCNQVVCNSGATGRPKYVNRYQAPTSKGQQVNKSPVCVNTNQLIKVVSHESFNVVKTISKNKARVIVHSQSNPSSDNTKSQYANLNNRNYITPQISVHMDKNFTTFKENKKLAISKLTNQNSPVIVNTSSDEDTSKPTISRTLQSSDIVNHLSMSAKHRVRRVNPSDFNISAIESKKPKLNIPNSSNKFYVKNATNQSPALNGHTLPIHLEDFKKVNMSIEEFKERRRPDGVNYKKFVPYND